jgi:endogenous inhibitor of DNA gyrase (YacG/DUF329 family)
MYEDKWRRLRMWTYGSYAMFGLGIPIAFVLSFPSFGGANNYFVPCWFGASVLVSGVAASFRCPRCNKPFFKPNFLAYSGWSKKCVHCGLPEWATDAPGRKHDRRSGNAG